MDQMEDENEDEREREREKEQEEKELAGGAKSGRTKEIFDQFGNKIEPEDNCNLYIAGIPKRTTEDALRKNFS